LKELEVGELIIRKSISQSSTPCRI